MQEGVEVVQGVGEGGRQLRQLRGREEGGGGGQGQAPLYRAQKEELAPAVLQQQHLQGI